MPSLGMQEIIVIFIIALIIFGPRKLPELGKTLGKGLSEFKKASNDLKKAWEDEVELEKEKNSLKDLLHESTAAITEPAAELSRELKESTDVLKEPAADFSKELKESANDFQESIADYSKEIQ